MGAGPGCGAGISESDAQMCEEATAPQKRLYKSTSEEFEIQAMRSFTICKLHRNKAVKKYSNNSSHTSGQAGRLSY